MSDKRSFFQEDEVIGKFYDARLVRRLLPFVRPHLVPAAVAISMVILGMGLFLVNPYILGRVVDDGITLRDSAAVTRFSLIYGLIELFLFIMAYGQNFLLQYVGQKVMFDIRERLFSHLQRLPVQFFDKNPVGRLVTRATNDVAAMGELFSSGIVVVIGDLFVILGIIVALLLLNPLLGVATLSTIPLLVWAAYFFQSRIREAFRNVRTRIARVNAALSENISGMRIIQIFNRESDREARFDELNAGHRDAQFQSLFYHSLFTPVVTVINGLTISIVLLLGGWMVMKGEIKVGLLVSFLAYAQHFFFPIRDISEKITVFQSAMASAERVFGLLDEVPEKDWDSGDSLPSVQGKIVFEDVSFSYIPGEAVLKNVSFTVEPGTSVAIVGHTGAGKTTISSLLNRFYDVGSGRVTLDGVDLRSLSKGFLRQTVSVIQQDVFIFSGPIIENIRLWDREKSAELVDRVTRDVHADGFIRGLEKGLETELYERGANLSVGQRQLISFARALCAEPKVLILDEATSSVDSETEKIIQEAIRNLTRNRTCLIIAHRLSTIQNCDKILVMHRGMLVEEGKHEDLLAKRGYYHKLHEIQFKDQVRNGNGRTG